MPSLSPAFLSTIMGLRIRAAAVLEGTLAGVHRSPFHGYSSEFSQYKGYVPGDDTRHLDWKVYGRRDQLVLRQYRDETNATVHLAIDTSASMGYRAEGDALGKIDYARILAAALTLLAERQRDTVALAHGGTSLESFLPPAGGPRATGDILRRLDSLKAEGETDLEKLFAQEAARITGQSFVFLFTDLWQDPAAIAAGLRRVRRKSRAATVVQLRTRDEDEFLPDGAWRLRDVESGVEVEVAAAQARPAYLAALKAHALEVARECAQLNLRIVTLRTDMPLDVAMRRVLP